MGLDPIISQICGQADDFLSGVTKRGEAKAGIAEFLTMHHAGISAANRKAVTDQAMHILDRGCFFERDAGGEVCSGAAVTSSGPVRREWRRQESPS